MRTRLCIGILLSTVFGLALPTVATAQSAELAQTIEQRIVTDDDFARDDLYSWTTRENALALRRERTILVATATSGDGPTPFNRALKTVAKRSDAHGAVASLLREHKNLQRRRYAWTSPFATARPRGKRSYGTHLIRIRLRKEGWTGHFEPGKRKPFRFVNASGDAIPLAKVLERPEKIAAIFHTRKPPAVPEAFREYVLCNRDMIQSWSIGTKKIAERVRQESTMLRTLALFKRVRGRAFRRWRKREALNQASLAHRYQATLAFDIQHYRFQAKRLLRVAEALDAHSTIGPPLEVTQMPETE